jgi:Kef-type K+ transport system membrane component KefB
MFSNFRSCLAHTIADLGEFGVLLLIFIAGLEVYFDELTRNTRVALWNKMVEGEYNI